MTIASRNPMGLQVYETQIQAALSAVAGAEWTFHRFQVTSMRSDIPGARHSPAGVYFRAPLALALVLGAATYRRVGLVHRFDLRLPPHPGREVVTVHDLPPVRFPDEGDVPKSIAAGARRALAVICPSAFAAQEMHELLGVTRTHVIPYGLSKEYRNPVPASDTVLTSLGVREPFLVHAAGATARKNLAELAKAWRSVSRLYPELQLLLCGPPDPRRGEAFAGLPRVVMPGRVDSTTVASVMARAAAVVVPSLYEGFGLPALEGMACGAPVIAARAGALPEVCGEAAVLVSPTGEDIAEGIAKVLDDRDFAADLTARGRVRANQFSWEEAARAHLSVYRHALA
jgi:glycosyltransferase involved in cell wall biosynthesis